MWHCEEAFPKPEGLQVWFAGGAVAVFLEDGFS